ncbi:hypothetical protein N7519_008533 [Penicillium mononematosum]|uniref:uncharacterized protein n=1 Tax=Penicillium mononematosum TaxID=268346 RepID=UPI00254818D7|nr:uncharacterized protein N7519_008533 [Penicillium mononematosum]KAJ6178072.1 hypothetical protein N7519_008533 [Penicillium mononematosum]
MPSRYSHVVTSPMAPLSEIIKLEPEREPWCAGYAPSQGRRCHARTNARGRSWAMMLLNDGTKDLRAGRNIDTLLEDLAPHVLCTRFHQSQASDLLRRWKRQVRTYLDSHVVSTPYTRPVRTSSQMIFETAEANMEERIAILHQRLRDAKEEIRRLKVAQSGLPVTGNPRHHGGRNMSAVVNPSSMGSTLSRNPPVNRPNEALRRDLTESSTNQSAIAVPRPVQAQSSRQTSAVSIPSPRSLNTPTVPRAFSRTGNTASQAETSQPNRHGDWDAEEGSENSGGDDHGDNDQDNDDEDDDDDDYDDDADADSDDNDDDADDDERLKELVWCKARCGVNFHKQCIDQWLETDHAPTCPACRSTWKH